MKRNIAIWGLSMAIVILLLANCSKDEIDINQKELLGKWISLNKNDTLSFTTNNDFYKSNGFMTYDHYDYDVFKDSIEVRYAGKMYILIYPTRHKFSINNDHLTIDFSNKQCYGFELKEMTYIKENNQ